jgi:hypothetical protein
VVRIDAAQELEGLAADLGVFVVEGEAGQALGGGPIRGAAVPRSQASALRPGIYLLEGCEDCGSGRLRGGTEAAKGLQGGSADGFLRVCKTVGQPGNGIPRLRPQLTKRLAGRGTHARLSMAQKRQHGTGGCRRTLASKGVEGGFADLRFRIFKEHGQPGDGGLRGRPQTAEHPAGRRAHAGIGVIQQRRRRTIGGRSQATQDGADASDERLWFRGGRLKHRDQGGAAAGPMATNASPRFLPILLPWWVRYNATRHGAPSAAFGPRYCSPRTAGSEG